MSARPLRSNLKLTRYRDFHPRGWLPRENEMPAKASVPKSGTPRAIKDNIQGRCSTSALTTWGGARNFKNRTSSRLSLAQCSKLIAAGDRATALGMPFNRHWTIHYQNAGVSEENATRFIGHVLKLAREYATRHGGSFACIWVRENGPRHGGHVHILMHLPAALSLRGRSRKWIELAGGICRKKVSRIRSIGGTLLAAETGGLYYAFNAGIVRDYLLKGVVDEAVQALPDAKFERGGVIVGKRCGYSQNIRPMKRMECWWPSMGRLPTQSRSML